MSHFAVLVFGPDPEGQLAAHHEDDGGFYDWYRIGGRWDNALTRRDGVGVNTARAGELDWDESGSFFGVLIKGVYKRRREVYDEIRDNAERAALEQDEWELMDERLTSEWQVWWDSMVRRMPSDVQVTLVDCHV